MMALDNNFLLFSQQHLQIDWDLHSFQLGDVHELSNIMPLGITSISCFSRYLNYTCSDTMIDTDSPLSSEASTGYLQDAVSQCKRRRLNSSNCDAMFATEDVQDFFQGFWDNSSLYEDPFRNLNFLVEENSNVSIGDNNQKCSSQLQQDLLSPPSSSRKESGLENSDKKESQNSRDFVPTPKDKDDQQATKRKKRKIVHPFAVLKPVGLHGDVTLDDINERILMRPTRPVKHPVGEFACRPCISADGPGLSGKAVVGLTRIHTQGKGTLTIIRTRG